MTPRTPEVEPKGSRRFLPPRRKERAAATPTPPAAPSAEMAWLLRKTERFEEQAEEVQAFLAELGLEQYASLLERGAGAPGSSMEALRGCPPELLDEARVIRLTSLEQHGLKVRRYGASLSVRYIIL